MENFPNNESYVLQVFFFSKGNSFLCLLMGAQPKKKTIIFYAILLGTNSGCVAFLILFVFFFLKWESQLLTKVGTGVFTMAQDKILSAGATEALKYTMVFFFF